MNHAKLIGLSLSCAAVLAAGCHSKPQARVEQDKNTVDVAKATLPDADARLITVEGCVTASGDRYMLTSLKSDPKPTTEAYQLVNAGDQLKGMVGREVRINGQAEPPLVAEAREVTPSQPVGTTGQETARVTTQQDTRVEMSTLRVSSVTATGDDCPALAR